MACMRRVFFLLAALLPGPLACTTESPTPAADDAAVLTVDEAGSPAECQAAGGTCVTFQTECPVLQQNTVLCGDSVMICCLPPDDAAPYLGPPDEGGVEETGSPPVPDAGPETGPVDAASDAGNG
jgi:hypothetical protein